MVMEKINGIATEKEDDDETLFYDFYKLIDETCVRHCEATAFKKYKPLLAFMKHFQGDVEKYKAEIESELPIL